MPQVGTLIPAAKRRLAAISAMACLALSLHRAPFLTGETTMNVRFFLATMLAVCGASAIACGDSSSAPSDETYSDPPAASSGNEDPAGTDDRLSDAQIAQVTSTANVGEVAQANAALPKLTNPDAKQFATMMVEQHGAAQERAAAMLEQKGLTPAASYLSIELKEDSDEIIEEINTADRDEVDKVYMEAQVEVHEKVLKTIDEKLIPAATDPALQQELQTARGEVATHLQRAKEIVEKLE
jgi:putative membrane protein